MTKEGLGGKEVAPEYITKELGPRETRDRNVIVLEKGLRGLVAKWAVQQSPYDSGPEGLDKVLAEVTKRFRASPLLGRLDPPYHHTSFIELQPRRTVLHPWLEALLFDIPEVAAWNVRKNGREGMGVTSAYDGQKNPDDDFIDLYALVQNVASDLLASAESD